MNLIRAYAIHAISEDADDATYSPQQTRRGFDYAALLRRARVRARDGQPIGNQASSGRNTHVGVAPMPTGNSDEAIDPAGVSEQDERTRSSLHRERSSAETANATTIDPQAVSPAESLTLHLQRLDPPYLDALSREQQTVFVLLDYLTARVIDFCTDPAVLAQGYWTMRLRLDPAILPDCTLALTLSYFDLTLRFEARDATARQLVLHHADVLKQRLEALLAQHDAPRTVEILTD